LTKKIISHCWCVAIEIKEKLYKGTIMVVYRSSSASHGNLVRFLEDIVEETTIKGDCMVLGDFNILYGRLVLYKEIAKPNVESMKQYVIKPTRVTKDSQTIIDLLFVNNKVQLQVIHEPKITDHAWLKIVLYSKIKS